jgi:hypothetical protein
MDAMDPGDERARTQRLFLGVSRVVLVCCGQCGVSRTYVARANECPEKCVPVRTSLNRGLRFLGRFRDSCFGVGSIAELLE